MKEEASNEMMTLEDFLAESGVVEEKEEIKLHGRNHEGSENWVDPMLHHLVGCLRSFIGETSASSSAAGTSYSSGERDYSIKQCSSISSNNGVFYHNFMSNNESDGHPFDIKVGNEEENEGGLRAEDFEIRMDLTYDLLHMVFSFLDHCNLCNAAIICRQWRLASAHEDFRRYPNATEVNLSGTPSMHLLVMKVVHSLRCPLLKNLSLKRSNMSQAALNCPLLQLLDISACHKLTDATIGSAVTSCPQLESLDMSNYSCVSDETLQEIARSCFVLHVLNSSYCPNISLESVRLPMLMVLKLDNCEGITLALMGAIAYSYILEEMEFASSLRQSKIRALTDHSLNQEM
ncbi:hypothetical protein F3Y22_tig00110450pilonHSYRG00538 [Hibiscus syriacus]|uniref:F-box domain-containing protein n=1 Tax=Hibiscus syriacus TaxID=106335 RepID=A0A6A3AKG3_HIBSY|nr:hypothetical protein F3Y22_tig00110450pilonHSYRG00538 [Hibiscus syriacus]